MNFEKTRNLEVYKKKRNKNIQCYIYYDYNGIPINIDKINKMYLIFGKKTFIGSFGTKERTHIGNGRCLMPARKKRLSKFE